MENFQSFNLPVQLLNSLTHAGYNSPTPIQAQAIPIAMGGIDILGSAQTGTGKTAAFGIPILAKLMGQPQGSALILTPTRELAAQVHDVLRKLLGGNREIKTALLIGGESMHRQMSQLKLRPRIIIGTPGRVNDHLERRSLRLNDAQFLVLDETDRMLDMGFSVQIDRIIKHLPFQRQTMLFSATLPSNIIALSKKYLKNPQRISVGSTGSPVVKIKQEIIHVSQAEKYGELLKELAIRQGSVIVFVRTKRGAQRMAEKLVRDKQSASAIHGDLQQNRRTKVIAAFRDKQHRILVATDVAARGLDIPHIEHVINFDLPQSPEDYVHRIGRTARAGAEGSALCLVSGEDAAKWRDIQRSVKPEVTSRGVPQTPPPGSKNVNTRSFYPRGGSKQRWFGQRRAG